MKKCAREIPEEEILQKVFAKLPWGHIIALLDKVKSESERAFYIDLLFYNVKLHCYFVIELKTGAFQPEYAGKLNFYLSAVDSQMRSEGDAPTIGLILCKGKNDVVAEYSLRDMTKPMGVSAYRLTRELPEMLKDALPSGKDFERL